MAKLYWLSDGEWARIEPLLPRGRRGAHRVDDRRVISGIVHVALQEVHAGATARPPTALHDHLQSLQPLEPVGLVERDLLRPDRLYWKLRRHRCRRQHPHQGASLCGGGTRGAFQHAIGRSRGGRTTKIHALTDECGRPVALTLTAGNVHDLEGARDLLAIVPTPRRLIADRAYDAKRLREWLRQRGAEAVIPRPIRRASIPTQACKSRNLIERMFCRLKDFRRVATRYDKLARNFLAGALIAAAVTWWLN